MATMLERAGVASELRVRHIMQQHAIRIEPDASVRQLVTLLGYYGISSVPVVERSGRVTGVVSAADVLQLAAEESRVPIWYIPREQALAGEPMAQPARSRPAADSAGPQYYQELLRPLLEDLSDHLLDGRRVRDVMAPVTVAVAPSATIPELAHLLLRTGVERALVIEEEKLLGVVSSADLLRAIARGDGTGEPDESFRVSVP